MGNQPWWAFAMLISVVGICFAAVDELAIFPRSWRGLGWPIMCGFLLIAGVMTLTHLAG